MLSALWQLIYIDKEISVTAEKIYKKAGLNKNQFHAILGDLWQISTDCYVQSYRNAVGNLAGYTLKDEWLISTTKTARVIWKLYLKATELRIDLDTLQEEIVTIFGKEKVDERIAWLIDCGYLLAEEKRIYHFRDRFIAEIVWIKNLAEYSDEN